MEFRKAFKQLYEDQSKNWEKDEIVWWGSENGRLSL